MARAATLIPAGSVVDAMNEIQEASPPELSVPVCASPFAPLNNVRTPVVSRSSEPRPPKAGCWLPLGFLGLVNRFGAFRVYA